MSVVDYVAGKLQILLAEYSKLKDEQNSRIDRRDQLLGGNLVAVFGIVYAYAQTGQPWLLLGVTVVTFVLGWLHTAYDKMVTDLGTYLRTRLGPALTALARERAPMLGWEQSVKERADWWQRRVLHLSVQLVTFPFAGIGAAIAFGIALDAGPRSVESLWPLLAGFAIIPHIVLVAKMSQYAEWFQPERSDDEQ